MWNELEYLENEFVSFKNQEEDLKYMIKTLEKDEKIETNITTLRRINHQINNYKKVLLQVEAYDPEPYYELVCHYNRLKQSNERKLFPRKHIKRNKDIVVSVLSGETLKSTASQYNLTRERVRQIVAYYCAKINSKYQLLSLKDKRALSDSLIPKINAL